MNTSLTERLQQCLYELSEDSRMVRAGLSTTPHSEEIMKKYPELGEKSTIEEAKKHYEDATDPEQKELYKRQYFFALSFYIESHIAGIQDELDQFYATQTATVDGEEINYFSLPLRVQQESDPKKREDINNLRLEIVQKGIARNQEMMHKTLSILMDECGFESYIDFCGEKKDMDYDLFHDVLSDLYEQVRVLYMEHMDQWTKADLNMSLGEIKKVHASVLVNLSRFDDLIKGTNFEEHAKGIFASMGLPFTDFPTIHLDLEDRPSKNPRACCYSTRVPEEIHLLQKPTGKLTDYETFLHESGHAMHYASTNPALPTEMKEFGLSYALTETFAFLFEKLMFKEDFLQEHFDLSPETAKEVAYYHTLTNLWFLVRYIGKFMYEYAFFSADTPPEDGALYASTLTEATGFIYDRHSFLEDMDGEFYSADYLRAWIAERQLNAYLEEHYGKRWYSSKEASAFLKSLWALGDSIALEDMIETHLRMKPFDTTYLVQSYQIPLTA